jgi:hypothetical protein
MRHPSVVVRDDRSRAASDRDGRGPDEVSDSMSPLSSGRHISHRISGAYPAQLPSSGMLKSCFKESRCPWQQRGSHSCLLTNAPGAQPRGGHPHPAFAGCKNRVFHLSKSAFHGLPPHSGQNKAAMLAPVNITFLDPHQLQCCDGVCGDPKLCAKKRQQIARRS